ncbi:single-stranded DNA-binding protein [Saccharothrix variisporea]|uniref:Single-strand DNA-binding protein n=1 Tax=Saccharothrix variisporea TaxID=543527 RepID=A0A495XAN1_9PSEU|nr:single-stranded DNA-binding protein [Saccharothrix variisporea]RKT70155.1 single-strand DNA-binding protein [Saccharothrix variisporea]
MAYNETRVTITGVVASEVTRTVVGTGYSRANFRMLTRERWWDVDREAWIEGGHMFLSVTCWRNLADNVKASLANRDPVFVAGKLTIKELPDSGKYRQFIDIEAYAVGPDLTSCRVAITRPPDTSPPPPAGHKPAPNPPKPAATTPDPAATTPDPAATAPDPAAPDPAAPGPAEPAATTPDPPKPAIAAPRKEGETAPTRRKPRATPTPPAASSPTPSAAPTRPAALTPPTRDLGLELGEVDKVPF